MRQQVIESAMVGFRQMCLEHNLLPLILVAAVDPDEKNTGSQLRVLTTGGGDLAPTQRILRQLLDEMETPGFAPRLIGDSEHHG